MVRIMAENVPATAPAGIAPLVISPDEISLWSSAGGSWQHRLARLWVRFVPRGKGWFPRLMGRRFAGPNVRDIIHTASGATLAMDLASLDIYCAIEASGGVWD